MTYLMYFPFNFCGAFCAKTCYGLDLFCCAGSPCLTPTHFVMVIIIQYLKFMFMSFPFIAFSLF